MAQTGGANPAPGQLGQLSRACPAPTPRARQATGSTGPRTNRYMVEPIRATAAETAKAQKNWPVLSTTNPVMAGAVTPARFPTKFCKPDHLPAARGPAMVWVMAQWLEANTPYDMQPSIRKTMDATGLETHATARIIVAPPNPPPVQVLRTRVGVTPAAMKRSDSHPAIVVAVAVAKYAREPMVAITFIEKCRSRTR